MWHPPYQYCGNDMVTLFTRFCDLCPLWFLSDQFLFCLSQGTECTGFNYSILQDPPMCLCSPAGFPNISMSQLFMRLCRHEQHWFMRHTYSCNLDVMMYYRCIHCSFVGLCHSVKCNALGTTGADQFVFSQHQSSFTKHLVVGRCIPTVTSSSLCG